LYVCSHVQVMAGFLLRMNCCKPEYNFVLNTLVFIFLDKFWS